MEIRRRGFASLHVERKYVAVLPEAHPLAGRKTLGVKALEGEPFIMLRGVWGRWPTTGRSHVANGTGFHPNIVQDAPQWLTLVRLVAAGLGVTLRRPVWRGWRCRGRCIGR